MDFVKFTQKYSRLSPATNIILDRLREVHQKIFPPLKRNQYYFGWTSRSSETKYARLPHALFFWMDFAKFTKKYSRLPHATNIIFDGLREVHQKYSRLQRTTNIILDTLREVSQ